MLHMRGFTLIELLVVIAIIGTLSTVTIVNVNKARAKGMDAAAMATVKSALADAYAFYDDHGTFGNASYRDVCCPASPGISCDMSYIGGTSTAFHDMLVAAGKENKKNAYCAAYNATGESFTAFVMLRADMEWDSGSSSSVSTKAFCIDSSGFAGIIPAHGNGHTSVTAAVVAANGGSTTYQQSIRCQ